jgi:hypothetical protein
MDLGRDSQLRLQLTNYLIAYLKLRIKKNYVRGISCDLAMAPDCVNHKMLLKVHYGVQGVNAD